MGNSPSKDGSSSSTLLAPSAAKKADDPDPSRSRRLNKHSLHASNSSIPYNNTNQLDIINNSNQIISTSITDGSSDEEIAINNINPMIGSNTEINNKNNNNNNNNTNNNDNYYTINSDSTSRSPTKHHHHSSSSPSKKFEKSLDEETYYDLEIASSLARSLSISKTSSSIPIKVISPSSQDSDRHHVNHSAHISSPSMSRLVNSANSGANNEFIASSLDSNASCFTNNSLTSASSATTPTMYKETLYPILETSVESSPIPMDIKDKSTTTDTVETGSSSSLSDSPPVFEQEMEKKLENSSFKKNSSSHSSLSTGGTDIDAIIETLVEAGLSKKNPKKFFISPTDIKYICSKSRDIFLNQPTLLELAAPVKVVGDVHGQFQDLLRIFKLCGFPPNANYLFLGDYVDRGKQSLETIILLLCLKIKYPENFFMLRGNHESASITKMYGFYDECKRRANVKIWKLVVDVFNTLPVAATVADKIFCVHGGLSPHLTSLAQIKNIQRPTDIPESGLLADLLWSDPDVSSSEWTENDRGVSYCFNKKVVSKFCNLFQFDLIVRGHMVVEEGYEFFAKRKLVTVFSAPNYCGEFDNWGAVVNVDKNLMCSFELLKPTSLLKKK